MPVDESLCEDPAVREEVPGAGGGSIPRREPDDAEPRISAYALLGVAAVTLAWGIFATTGLYAPLVAVVAVLLAAVANWFTESRPGGSRGIAQTAMLLGTLHLVASFGHILLEPRDDFA
jgi:uncharacterized membrane protein YphA (DoxX/SURF4 family)